MEKCFVLVAIILAYCYKFYGKYSTILVYIVYYSWTYKSFWKDGGAVHGDLR